MGKTPIHVINALLAMQLVIDAKDKDKTVAELTTEVQELTVNDPDHHTDELTFSDVVYLNTVGGDSATEQNSTTSWNA